MSEITIFLCVIVGGGILGLFLIAGAIRIVPEYERIIVFRLGRSLGQRGPGLVLMTPFVDRGTKVDLREQVREIPPARLLAPDFLPQSSTRPLLSRARLQHMPSRPDQWQIGPPRSGR